MSHFDRIVQVQGNEKLRNKEDKKLKTAYMSGQRTARFNMRLGAIAYLVSDA